LRPEHTTSSSAFDRIRKESPNLYEAISSIVRDLWNAVKYKSPEDTFFNTVEADVFDEHGHNALAGWPYLYQTALLTLFNIESLVLKCSYLSYLGLTFQTQHHYQASLKYFRELRIEGRNSLSHAAILPLLRLPQIRLLMVDEFCQHEYGEIDILETEKE
jgi:hypothetical protein